MAEGLRERKRRATSVAIQRAALELAIEGNAPPTVDAIARRANVSARTFFNYFPTRDDALLGDRLELAAVAPDAGSGVAELLEAVILATIAERDLDRELVLLRRRVLQAAPGLFARRFALNQEFEQVLIALAVERATADGVERPETRGRHLALLAAATMRAGWLNWVEDGEGRSLDAVMRQAFDDQHSLARTEFSSVR